MIFALLGLLFLMTQYLQFVLGFSALRAGLAIGPVALVLLVAAPFSAVLARRIGTKSVIVPGLLLIALGLGFLSQTTVSDGYRWCLPFFLLIGCGVGLALAPSTNSVMGSVTKDEAGVGSATSDTSMQVGGALGVAVLGTALNLRYQHLMTALISHHAVPSAIRDVILGSLGGALQVAARIPGPTGAALADAARRSFVSGMDLGLLIAAIVVAAAAALVLLALPQRPHQEPHPSTPPAGLARVTSQCRLAAERRFSLTRMAASWWAWTARSATTACTTPRARCRASGKPAGSTDEQYVPAGRPVPGASRGLRP